MSHLSVKLAHYFDNKNKAGLSVDLDTELHGVTVVWGQSGSGKTSLLRAIAGLLKSDKARIHFNQTPWQTETLCVPTHQRSIGYVFQQANLFHHLTGWGNVQYGIKRATNPLTGDRLTDLVTIMNISHLLNKYPRQMSGGEQQRVAIVRALATNPSLLLLDEPLASLDHTHKGEIIPYLLALKQQANTPIIYVTHSSDEVYQLADRVIILEDGQIRKIGSVHEVIHSHPIDTSLGALLNAHVIKRHEHWSLVEIDSEIGRLWATNDILWQQDSCRLKIDAKDVSISLVDNTQSSTLNRLKATVKSLSRSPNSPCTTVVLSIGNYQLKAQITTKSAEDLALSPNQTVWAQIKALSVA